MGTRLALWARAALAALVCGGCGDVLQQPERVRDIPGPEYLGNTVGQRAFFTGGEPLLVRGLGLVTGLDETGSTTHPPGLRTRMLKIITPHGVPNPERILADPNTAVVTIAGYLPPGCRAGEKFDLVVTAAPGTQTTSLAGGTLLAADLARVEPTRTGTAQGSVLAVGRGELFVSPFVAEGRSTRAPPSGGGIRPITPEQPDPPPPADEPGPPAMRSDPRVAWVLGGGQCRQTRAFYLNQLEPSERTAHQIIRHINARFPGAAKGNINPGIIDLKVPADYVHDKLRFLDVVGAVYLVDSPDRRERRVRELVAQLEAVSDRQAVVAALEAFGKPTIALVDPLLKHPDAAVRFSAARVLARLNQSNVLGVLDQFVRDDDSPYQEPAVLALADLSGGGGAAVIREALDARSPAVRITAYLVLRRIAPNMLTAAELPGRLELATVETRAGPFVFVGRQLQPRVVLFGDVRLYPPLLVDTPRLLASVREGEPVTLVNKRWGAGHKIQTSLNVGRVVAVLAGPPGVTAEDPKPKGLDLLYSDVVGFLDQAFKAGALKARIVYEPVQIVTPAAQQLTTPGGPDTDIVIPPR